MSDNIKYSSLISGFFKWLSTLDRGVTNFLAITCMQVGFKHYLRPFLKIMEWSILGYGWLTVLGFCLYFTKNVRHIPVYLNTFLALLFDWILISIIKVTFRRSRPLHNQADMVGMIPYIDDFSFPSMHSSRASMMTQILIKVLKMNPRTTKCALVYPVAMAISRVMLGRHYLSDVLAGLLLGAMEGYIVNYFWLKPETCLAVVKMFRRVPSKVDNSKINQ